MPASGFGNPFAIPRVDTQGLRNIPQFNPNAGLGALIQAQNAVMRGIGSGGRGGGAYEAGGYKGVGDPSKGRWVKLPGQADLVWVVGTTEKERNAAEVKALNAARAQILQADTELQTALKGFADKSIPGMETTLEGVRKSGIIARLAPQLEMSEADTAKLILDTPQQQLEQRRKAVSKAGFFRQVWDAGAEIADKFTGAVEALGASAEEKAAIGQRMAANAERRRQENARADEFARLEREGRSTAGYWLTNPFDTAAMYAAPLAATLVPQLAAGTLGGLVGGPIGATAGFALGGGLSSAAYGAGEMLERAATDPNLTPEQRAQAASDAYTGGGIVSGIIGAIPAGPSSIATALGRRAAARTVSKLPEYAAADATKRAAMVAEEYAARRAEHGLLRRAATSGAMGATDAATLGIAEQAGHNLAYAGASGLDIPVTEGWGEQGLAGAVLGAPLGFFMGRRARYMYPGGRYPMPEPTAEAAATSQQPVGTPTASPTSFASRAEELVRDTPIKDLQRAIEDAYWRGDITETDINRAILSQPNINASRIDAINQALVNVRAAAAPGETNLASVIAGTGATSPLRIYSTRAEGAVVPPRGAMELLLTTPAKDLQRAIEAAYWRGDITEAHLNQALVAAPLERAKFEIAGKFLDNLHRPVEIPTSTAVERGPVIQTIYAPRGEATPAMPRIDSELLIGARSAALPDSVQKLYYTGSSLDDITSAAQRVFRNNPTAQHDVLMETMRLQQHAVSYASEAETKKIVNSATTKRALQQRLEAGLDAGGIDPGILDNVKQSYSAKAWRAQAMDDALAAHRARQTAEKTNAGRPAEPVADVAADGRLAERPVDTTDTAANRAEPVDTTPDAATVAARPVAEAGVRDTTPEGRGDAGAATPDTGQVEAPAAAPAGAEPGRAAPTDGERGIGAAAEEPTTAGAGERSVEPAPSAGPRGGSDGTDIGWAETVGRIPDDYYLAEAKRILEVLERPKRTGESLVEPAKTASPAGVEHSIDSLPNAADVLVLGKKALYPGMDYPVALEKAADLMRRKAAGDKLNAGDKLRYNQLKRLGVPDMEVNVPAVEAAVTQSREMGLPTTKRKVITERPGEGKRRVLDNPHCPA